MKDNSLLIGAVVGLVVFAVLSTMKTGEILGDHEDRITALESAQTITDFRSRSSSRAIYEMKKNGEVAQ